MTNLDGETKRVARPEINAVSNVNLDEVGKVTFTSEARARAHTKLELDLAETKDFGIGKHFTLVETPEFGPNTGVLHIKGMTGSEIEGLSLTQHEISVKVKDVKDWSTLSPKERHNKLITEIIPKAKSMVVGINGWGGNQGIWRPYMPHLLNPVTGGTDDEELLAGNIIGMKLNEWAMEGSGEQVGGKKQFIKEELKELPSDTLFIGISIMGGLGELNEHSNTQLTKDKVLTQVFEAVDKIGLEIIEAKLKYIESEEYKSKKTNLIQNIHSQLINDIDATNDTEWKRKFLDLNAMLSEEELITNGRYADEMLAEIVGHSMGGNIALTIWRHAILGQKMPDDYILYRARTKQENRSIVESYKARVEKVNNELFTPEDFVHMEFAADNDNDRLLWDDRYRNIGGVFNSGFLNTLRLQVRNNLDMPTENDIPDFDISHKYRKLNLLALMPVVSGNMAQDNPKWLDDIKTKIPEWPVGLSNDALINLTAEISRLYPRGGETVVKAGEVVKLIGAMVRKYVGKGTPNDEELWQQYILNLREVLFVAACHEILSDMSPPFYDETLKLVSDAKLARVSGFTGSKDATVFSAYANAMGGLLSGFFSDSGRPVIQTLEGTQHHPQTKDMPKVNSEFWGKLIWAERLRLSENYQAFLKSEQWLKANLPQGLAL